MQPKLCCHHNLKLPSKFIHRIIPNSKVDKINGYLLTSFSLKYLWKKLDCYEGKHYQRVITDVYLKNNQKTKAYIYSLKIAEL
ncbi:MAG: hypothetical protein ACKPKO_20890 [Candidatus Fonsibacter sp.]